MMDLRKFIDAALHFGHKTSFWSPKMQVYIWGQKNKIHLIDVSKTAAQLEKAMEFLKGITAEGKTVLWVGTKKAARPIITSAAVSLDQPFVTHRWIGGTLTNYPQVKKSVTKLLHAEDILAKSDQTFYTKKELNSMQKAVNRLKANIGGIINLKWPVGAVVIIDVNKEQAALKEAVSMGVPVVALVDTNSDPTLVDFVIPGNDDAPKAIKFIVDHLAEAVSEGKKLADDKRAEAKKAFEAKKAEEAKSKPKKETEEKKEVAKKVAAEETSAVKTEQEIKKVAPKAPVKTTPAKKTTTAKTSASKE